MYNASNTYKNLIKSNVRKLNWSGTITLDNTTLNFSSDNILSGSLTRQISGSTLEIGTVYASELKLEVYLPSVSRYALFGKRITLKSTLDGATDVIPMGTFTIAEATQAADHISITAYDDMLKFSDANFAPTLYVELLTPYQWLTNFCTAAGVTLGMSESDVLALPNGNRYMGYADDVGDTPTLRDALSYLAKALCSYCYIGRDGKLYLGTYGMQVADTVPASFRFSSDLSDFRTGYEGLGAVYKLDGVREYVDNNNTGGLVLELDVNPFLQFTNSTNRLAALQSIIDLWDGVWYIPFEAEMPLIPIYDVGDVIQFYDNQSAQYDYGAITELTFTIGGTMSVKCSGENPLLMDSYDKFSKTVEGANDDYTNGQEVGTKEFWILHTTNTAELTVGSTKMQVAEIEWNQSVDVMRLGMMFSCECSLSKSSDIRLVLTVDDNNLYTYDVTKSKTRYGTEIVTADCGFTVHGKALHTAKAYLTVTDSALLWSDLI